MIDVDNKNLNISLNKLRDCPLLPVALGEFQSNTEKINLELLNTINTQIPAFVTTRNPDIGPQLKQYIAKHTEIITALLTCNEVINFDFVRKYNQQQARQYFPLESSLHAYRICHKAYTQQLRSAVLNKALNKEELGKTITAIDDFTLEYTDAVSTLATKAYIEQTRIMTAAAGDKRAELLSILLDGFDESDARVSNILREAGYLDEGLLFCIAVAQSVEPAEMLNHERARRMADSIDKLSQLQHGNRLIDVRDNKVVAVFSDNQRISGWAKPHQGLAEQIHSELAMVGNAALIGISNDVKSTSQIPKAYQQALLALKLASPTKRVVCTAHLSTRDLLLHLSGQELRRSLPLWTSNFYLADDKSRGSLSATLRTYAKTNMNLLKAGAVLSIHPNTIYARFQKIHELTGLDARRFHALNELLLICDVRQSVN